MWVRWLERNTGISRIRARLLVAEEYGLDKGATSERQIWERVRSLEVQARRQWARMARRARAMPLHDDDDDF